MKTHVEEKFSDFYDKWMAQLEDLLQLLLLLSKGPPPQPQESVCAAAINKLTAHHKEYYRFKWAVAHDDVLAFFSKPVWLSPLETAHLWVTGWKPSAAFRLAGGAGATDEQVKKIEALRAKMKVEEGRVEREMERLQVAMADRKTVELVRRERWVRERGGAEAAQVEGLVEAAVGGFLEWLEKVMKMADCVRLKTLKGLLEILSPMQSVRFLASKSMFQITDRRFGIIEKNTD